ncbi:MULTISPECIES: CVNH domain-containing protein [unclassified Nostoc]|uniref:mannose-binding lectin n=1 Tax=unclassified Nostoc TaxID=2593658 RepID=UPI002AD37C13|nr:MULTISPECIES: CVNH domain-containing protein [unclassified Nostoc]MDZ8121489.1 CVNH domain-containing protein [Nostoc sp. CmiVER01]MDZ8222496.1 CVNH domain-containing protein [Nostoc sp. ChiVER01]
MSYLAKLSRSPRLMSLAACGAIIATIPINAAFAAPTDLSSYQNSCRNIDVSGATLTASCRRINGTYNSTSILIRGIFNGNGVLLYTSNPRSASSYQNSCRNINVAGATLTASCRRINGTYNSTSILIKGIDNINGVLRYS